MLSTVLLHVKHTPYVEFLFIQINAGHALQPYCLGSVLTLHSHLYRTLPSGLFLLSPPTKPLHPWLHTCHMSAHLAFLDLITRRVLREQHQQSSPSLCCVLYSLVTSTLLGRNIFLSTLFSNPFNLRSSTNVTDQNYRVNFLRLEEFNITSNNQDGRPRLFVCPLLLIQYIRIYFTYQNAISSIRNLRTRHVVVIGARLSRNFLNILLTILLFSIK
jgi:hypothetical protein